MSRFQILSELVESIATLLKIFSVERHHVSLPAVLSGLCLNFQFPGLSLGSQSLAFTSRVLVDRFLNFRQRALLTFEGMFQLFENDSPSRKLSVALSLDLDKVFQSLSGSLVLTTKFVTSLLQFFPGSFQVILLKPDSTFEQRPLLA